MKKFKDFLAEVKPDIIGDLRANDSTKTSSGDVGDKIGGVDGEVPDMPIEEDAKLAGLPEDILKLVGKLPIRDPKVVENDGTTVAVSVDTNMLFADDLRKIVEFGKHSPHISNRNDKLMLLFTIDEGDNE